MVENTREGSAQLRTPLHVSAFRTVQKANETVFKHRALHNNLVTPIRVDRLKFLPHEYDIILKQFLLTDCVKVFVLILLVRVFRLNLPIVKVLENDPIYLVQNYARNSDAGKIVGPFLIPPFLDFRCFPLGLVPRKDPSEFQMIHHLSYPKGSSVNISY